MNLEEIKGIIKLVSDANLHKVELEQEDIKIRLLRTTQQLPALAASLPQQEATKLSEHILQEAFETQPAELADSIITIKSTMIGTYSAAPAKDKPAFVHPGRQIKAGEPICTIKALNLLNEVEAEMAGVIEEVLVKEGDAIEYDQPLFLVKVSK